MNWFGRTPWDHQVYGATECVAAVDAGERRLCLTSPTGGGKTLIMAAAVDAFLGRGKKVLLLTNRCMLASQTIDVLSGIGLDFGVRASGMDHLAAAYKPFQVAMIQTEQTRLRKRLAYKLFPADVVLVDEAHNQKSGGVRSILDDYANNGAAIIGITATPVGIRDLYTKLIVAGRNSELRRCGALLPCRHHAPDEPAEALNLRPEQTGEFTEGDVVKAIMTPVIFGRVLEHYRQYNPHQRPSILFGPGVAESVWFARQFCEAGIPAAHIDGEHVWINGEEHPTSQDLRDRVLRMSREGEIKVICNRFVMREGIDAPWLYHCILATIFGSITSYIQSVGRLLRAYPGMDHVVLQDHGGMWWRLGSVNEDRHWDLDLDNLAYTRQRAERLRNKEEPEPIVCIKCGAVRLHGPRCATCGFQMKHKMRPVIQKDGTLSYMRGDIFRHPPTKQEPDTQDLWNKCYWRCRQSGKTFSQAMGLFRLENGYQPPDNLANMPKNSGDWYAVIKNVRFSDIHPMPPKAPKPEPEDHQLTLNY